MLNRAIPFLLLPVMTRYLAPDEFGTAAVYQVLLSFAIPFIGMSLNNNITRNFSSMQREEMARMIGLMTGLLGVMTGLGGGVAIAYTAVGGTISGIPGGWFLALPGVAALSMAHEFNLTVLRNREKPLLFGCFEVGSTILNLGVSLILVVGLGFGWQGRAAGVAVAAACFGAVGLVSLRQQRMLSFEFDRRVLRDVLRVSLPLIPHALGSVVIALSDRLFIDGMAGKEAVGLYAVGYTFGMIVNLFVESFNRAWSPWFYREMNAPTEERRQRIVRASYGYFAGILVLAVAVSGASRLILPYMVDPAYQASSEFILWIAIGYGFRGMYTMVFPYLVHTRRTELLGFGMFFTAGVNLLLNYVLIGMNGPIGAAQATLIAWFMLFAVTWFAASSVCPMPWLTFWRATPVRQPG